MFHIELGAKGFTAGGVHCGIRKSRTKRDLGLIYSEVPCSAAAVYTTNLVKGAPLLVTKNHLADGVAQACIINSGNANTCNANGVEIAEQTSSLLAKELGIKTEDVVVASTGVIGQPMTIDPFKRGVLPLVKDLSKDGSPRAAEAIMTTDTVKKEVAVSFELDGKEVTVGGIAKGSGMIHPNMATMLVFGPIGQHYTHHDKESDSDNDDSNYHSSTRRFMIHYSVNSDLATYITSLNSSLPAISFLA